jgi:ornithine--oxo-acid transaminase
VGFDLTSLMEERRGQGAALWARHLNPQFPRVLRSIGLDRDYERASGSWLYDADGRRYLDLLSGFGVFGVGRNHPVVADALRAVLAADLADLVQMDTPLLAGLLAERLLAKAPGLERVYLANSGTEAVEAALKFARYATRRRRILYCGHGYHGLTAGSLSVNGTEDFRRGFAPLLPDTRVAFGDLDVLERELRKGDVAALIVEPIQGKGVHIPPAGYLAAAQELLHRRQALLICDEVQTGLGRTGHFFAYQAEGVQPDLVTVAKTLSGGFVPVGATLATRQVFDRVYSSMDRMMVHDSTFGGNALAMAAGLASLAVIDDEGLVDNAARQGARWLAGLQEMAPRYELVADVRGRGLMIGVEFGRPRSLRLRGSWRALRTARVGLFAQVVVGALFERHRILTQVAGDHMDVIKLLPTLVVGDDEVDYFLAGFAEVMDAIHSGSGPLWHFGRELVAHAVRK